MMTARNFPHRLFFWLVPPFVQRKKATKHIALRNPVLSCVKSIFYKTIFLYSPVFPRFLSKLDRTAWDSSPIACGKGVWGPKLRDAKKHLPKVRNSLLFLKINC